MAQEVSLDQIIRSLEVILLQVHSPLEEEEEVLSFQEEILEDFLACLNLASTPFILKSRAKSGRIKRVEEDEDVVEEEDDVYPGNQILTCLHRLALATLMEPLDAGLIDLARKLSCNSIVVVNE
jgi:hypothetical protein